MTAAGTRRAIAALVLALFSAPAPAPAATVDYLYVEANEGGSAGGHVALGLGDEVFHLQHENDGLLQMHRDTRLVFRTRYALLENRPVHVARLQLPDDAATALRDALMRRWLIEGAERDRVAALDADVALYASLDAASGDAGALAWPVRAGGYFLSDAVGAETSTSGHSRAIAAVRDALLAAHGADLLDADLAATDAALAALPLGAVASGTVAPAPDSYPAFAPTVSTRLSELLELRTALQVLRAAPSLRADALVDAAVPPLTTTEVAVLHAFAQQSQTALLALVASARADMGYALLLGLARLAAVEASLQVNRLLVLDAWPADAPTPALPAADERPAYFAALREQTALFSARQRVKCLSADACREPDYTRLESALNRSAELTRAEGLGSAPRSGAEPLVPARPAVRRDLGLCRVSADSAATALQAARTAATDYRRSRARHENYELLTRNCVTELLAQLDDAARHDAPRPPWEAIPFVSATAVADDYPVIARETWPSFRQRAQQPTWGSWLTEATTLTARGYRPTARDSTFLFFTDSAVAPRPLFGAANVAVGLAGGTLGLVTWPVDGGRRLRGGLLGVLYSAPELVFVNLRKGTTAYLTTAELEGAGDDAVACAAR